ncbi:MAG TPA: acyltransferase [Candidatus Omnitrophota bacterium]|nr:acyltransferase [Candidatus Omnitrophota bacterium]
MAGNRLESYFATLIVRVRFYGCIHAKGKVEFGFGVHFIPFNANKFLSVVFDGGNRIGNGTVFQGTGQMTWGKNSYCRGYCVFGTNEKIEIGANVMIADAVSIRDTDHVFSDISRPSMVQGIKTAPVIIEDNAWIGHGAVVLKGVRIGRGAVVGAGAVVTKNVKPYDVVAGIPARIISKRT